MFPSIDNTQEYQANPRTHLRLACRLQLRPQHLVKMTHRCVQLCMQVFVYEVASNILAVVVACRYFLHWNNRERIMEHEHLLWLRIALRLQLRPPNFCWWHLGLRFCGCSNMGILGSFQLDSWMLVLVSIYLCVFVVWYVRNVWNVRNVGFV